MALLAVLGGCASTPVVEQAKIARKAEKNQQAPLIAIADRMASEGRHSAAALLYKQAYDDGENDAAALAGLARSLIALGRYAEAERILGAGAASGNADIYLGLGEVNLAFGRPAIALANYREASAAGGGARAQSGLAVALDMLDRHEEALDAHRDAARLAGNDLNIRSNLGLSLALHGETGQALDILETVAADPAAAVQHRQNLVLAYVLAGREDKATQIASIDLDPVSVRQTVLYFREIAALEPPARLRSLVYAAQEPERARADQAVLVFEEGPEKPAAAARIIEAAVQLPEPEPASEPEPAPAPAATPRPEPVGLPPLVDATGWSVQIAAYRTAEQLIAGRAIYWGRFDGILGDLEPRRSEIDFGERADPPRGFFYRLNAGTLRSFEEANAICERLEAEGAPCWVRPPEPAEGRLPAATGD